MQVLAGPRQVGKTTVVRQVESTIGLPFMYASADEPGLKGPGWIAQQWETARTMCRRPGTESAVLALDEIQKISGWSETVKRLWDEDSASGIALKVVVLGSAPLLVRQGLTESLAGRFEILHLRHWSFPEMRDAFGWDIDTFIRYGGYPGAASLVGSPDRWARYVLDSLVETTISRDVLLMTRVDKPALLRQLFDLGCRYSGQILSYTKMLGQLQDAGNTTTLAHYLDLLSDAGMVTGIQKYAGDAARRRASSPKLQVLNNALMTASTGDIGEKAINDNRLRGRLVESAVGAHLANEALAGAFELFYWRDGDLEVDFILRTHGRLTAIEVKSGNTEDGAHRGTEAFRTQFHPQRCILVGSGGIALEEFLSQPAGTWLNS
jgi:predicted AAA+ superfamily ATPase